ncbi:unnamed protein product [Peronospora belbahrii]|uniref:O-phosphoseryl-tRNA(Sec) selenium transferase n=1 Tax=Peronospora belbahrii TaxID=622444 RepID=A0ABN8D4Q6_9STRA|nr:unnamed protein product [Peronospora belbahrii]
MLLRTFSAMDSNNFRDSVGAGEREARVFSSLVARRHFGLAHGVGRSEDLAAVQPKAAGLSLMVQLANALAKDVLRLAGMRAVQAALVLPVATEILLQVHFGGWTHTTRMAALMDQYGSENILAVSSTTSCFAPRAYDRVKEIAEHCQKREIAHVINNVYGVQVSACVHQTEMAMRTGRATPTLDFFITMLQMGKNEYKRLLEERKHLAAYMREKLEALAFEEGERVIPVFSNEISFALTLATFCSEVEDRQEKSRRLTILGAMLFSRRVSGASGGPG